MKDDFLASGTPRSYPGDPPEVRMTDPAEKLGDIAAEAGLRSIEIVAWRDVDHPEAGGSEIHAARVAERWAAAGIDVTVCASRAPGSAARATRDGYRLRRPAGRYSIFPVAGARAWAGRSARPDGTVEIWNGMPFLSPAWARHPRVVFLHHVHGAMWDLVLPPHLAAAGRLIERRLAPPLYRTTPIVTLSESSKEAIVGELGLAASQVTVVEPGVDERFNPGGQRDQHPTVLAVGRLVPYKRFDTLVEILVRVHDSHPNLRAVIAGEGSERSALEALISRHQASEWLSLPGRVDDDALIDLYRRAWVLVSTSAFEGWGMTITEAGACATPAVASPVVGHVDAIHDGISGLLAEPGREMERALHTVLSNDILRHRLQRGAHRRASSLSWDRTARKTLEVLASDAKRRHPA